MNFDSKLLYDFESSSLTIKTLNPLFCYWDKLFTDTQLKEIVEYCECFDKIEAKIGGKGLDRDIRKTNISWIEKTEFSTNFIDPIHTTISKLNNTFYNFELTKYEQLQYTCYDKLNSKYEFHMDCGFNVENTMTRKLSCVMLLNDPSEYEGGDFEVMTNNQPLKIEFIKGRLIVFPSYILHRVTPIKSGVRRTLVNWISGPHFK